MEWFVTSEEIENENEAKFLFDQLKGMGLTDLTVKDCVITFSGDDSETILKAIVELSYKDVLVFVEQ